MPMAFLSAAFDFATVMGAIEQWPLTQAMKSSTYLYPFINAGHILSLMVFFAAVAVMDLRLLGGLKTLAPGPTIRDARRIAIAAFVVIAATGGLMFLAEAAELSSNWVFLSKLALIGFALLNVVALEFAFARSISAAGPNDDLPALVRVSAALSLLLWLSIAMFGRFIAYF